MNRNTNKRPQNKVNWSQEAAGAGKLAGKIIGRIFSYLLNIILTVLLICLITGIIVGTVFAVYIKNNIDPEVDLSQFSISNTNQTSRIYYMKYDSLEDRQNRTGVEVELEDQRLYGSDNSIWVSYTKFPKNLVNAYVAIEDKRFWSHHGVDWKSTAYSVINYFIPLGEKRGGSTITQQTIKNVTGDDDYTPQRKVQEILRALNLEKKLDKTQILEIYLNNIYLSQNCYGVQAAAYTYFNKDVSELTLIECAAIAAISNSPTRYDPVQNPDWQAYRRNLILDEMLDQGYITQAEYDEAYGKELVLDYQGRARDVSVTTNSWYTDQVIVEVVAALQEKFGYTQKQAYNYLYTGGLNIITLQDPELQTMLEDVYVDDSNFPRTNNAVQPQSSAVIIDPQNGDVVALVGARGEKNANLLLNYATGTTRSPGSSIKPLSVYAPALEYGLITYGSVYDDCPVWFNYKDSDTDKANPIPYPKNLPERYGGLTTVNDAVTRSVNTVALRILQDLTLDKSFDFVRNKLNMGSFIEAGEYNGTGITDKDYAPLALGAMNFGVTTLEMTASYQMFANGGVYNKPRTWLCVKDSSGNIILENESDSHVVISEQTASIMTKMLQNVVKIGTASACTLKNQIDVAGKTGTTSSDFDRWFVGYTPYYVCGIWFGYEMPQEIGSKLAWNPTVVGWDIIMTRAHQGILQNIKNGTETLKTFELADGIIEATYCKDSGKLMTAACYADPRGSRAEVGYFTASTIPSEYCDVHVMVDYDKVTGAVACENCPKENIKQVGLLKWSRSMPTSVKITDAQYTWRDVPAGTPMPEDDDSPFYIGLYGDGEYPGYSDTNGKRVYNSWCYEHDHEPEPEPEPEDTTPPITDGETPDTGQPGTDTGTPVTPAA